jgi:hypothetical protein
MLTVDPATRINLGEVLAHPWMQGPVFSEEELYIEMKARRECIHEMKSSEMKSHAGEAFSNAVKEANNEALYIPSSVPLPVSMPASLPGPASAPAVLVSADDLNLIGCGSSHSQDICSTDPVTSAKTEQIGPSKNAPGKVIDMHPLDVAAVDAYLPFGEYFPFVERQESSNAGDTDSCTQGSSCGSVVFDDSQSASSYFPAPAV